MFYLSNIQFLLYIKSNNIHRLVLFNLYWLLIDWLIKKILWWECFNFYIYKWEREREKIYTWVRKRREKYIVYHIASRYRSLCNQDLSVTSFSGVGGVMYKITVVIKKNSIYYVDFYRLLLLLLLLYFTEQNWLIIVYYITI